jgi:hypothetical protein
MITKKLDVPITMAVLLTAMLGASAGRLNAQAGTASIQGTVTDTSGAAVPETTLQVKNVNTGAAQAVTSNAQGRFVAADLGVGSYEVQAAKMGFQTVVRKGITLTVGAQSVVDFSLPVGQQQQTVTVEGQASQVDTTNSTVGTLTEQEQMHELPLNGRNFEQLIVLAPGVQQVTAFTSTSFQGRANEYSIAGARPSGQELLLDDENLQGFWSKGMSSITGSSLGVEAIGEFQLLTNTYSGQFGGNGTVVNAVTKSGTNNFHGSAFEFLRNTVLNSRNTFSAINPAFRRNQYGGSLGGPIKKDKAFFFVNYEGIQQGLTEVAVATVPNCSLPNICTPTTTNTQAAQAIRDVLALYPSPAPGTVNPTTGIGTVVQTANQPSSENYVVGRFDYAFSEKDAFFARYISDSSSLVEPFAGGGGFGNGALPLWAEHDSSHYQFATIEERRLISPTIVNVARISFSRPSLQGNTPPVFPALEQFYPGVAGREDGAVAITGLSGLGSATAPPFALTQNRFTEGDDVSWTHGSHSMRFGASITRSQSNTEEQRLYGSSWSFQGLAAFLADTPNTVSWTPATPQFYGIWAFRDIEFTPYFQDDWKVTPKLTLNLGIRWEFMTNPVEAHNNLWNITDYATDGITTGLGGPWPLFTNVPNVFRSNPSWKNFAPRFGFAYDPFADHKTSIRGGFGTFYDQLTPATYAAAYWQYPPFETYQAGVIVSGTIVPTFPILPTPSTGKFVPTGANGNAWDIPITPYMLQWNLNVQRDLGRNYVLTAGYLGSRGIHLLTALNLNPNKMTTDANGIAHFGTLSATGTVVDNPVQNPNLGAMTNQIPTTLSRYNALQTALNHRFSGNVQLQVAYTWSKCSDDGSSGLGSFQTNSPSAWTNPYNQSIEYGPCSFDITQVLSVNGLYALPFHKNKLVEGWRLSGIFRSSTGFPLTIADGVDAAGLGETNDRPNAVLGCVPTTVTAAQAINHIWYNPGCYSIQQLTTLGNLGRGTVRGPLLNNADLAFLKDTRIPKISEAFDVQFRAEFFNILNHPNYGLPGLSLFSAIQAGGVAAANASAGKITSIVGTPRQVQFALKIIF